MRETRYARLTLEYDGEPFFGWARQPERLTIEGSILDACAMCAIEVVKLRCAGRTDTGVHARMQVASLEFHSSIPDERLAASLNSQLHPSIAVVSAERCSSTFDPRGDAVSRAYEYRVLNSRVRSPLRSRRVFHHPRKLNHNLLHAAADAALGQHDFTAFTPSETLHTYFERTLFESRWEARGDEIVYCVRGNAFLRHMVRVLVGTMLSVGRGEMTTDEFVSLLGGAARSEADVTAPSHALCLVDVAYRG